MKMKLNENSSQNSSNQGARGERREVPKEGGAEGSLILPGCRRL